MASKKMIVLITGGMFFNTAVTFTSSEQAIIDTCHQANSGIGFELASQLLSDADKHVLLGSRSVEKGEAAVNDLQSRNLSGTVELLEVNVTSDDSIAAAAKTVDSKHGRLDALVNNAGIGISSGPLSQQMAQFFEVNATGPLLMLEAFAPLLERSSGTPRIVNVSTGLASIMRRLDKTYPFYPLKNVQYRSSKSALNMVTACQAVDYAEKGFKVFAFCPGFTVSNLGPYNSAENGAKPTSEGAAPLVEILNGARDYENGGFLREEGQHPW